MRSREQRAVHQFHPTVHYGDAIGEEILTLRRWLREDGIESEAFRVFPGEASAATRHFSDYARYSSPDNVLLLHYSINYPDEVWQWLADIPDRKVVIYHNITPPRYFLGVNADYYREAERGLKNLPRLRALAPRAWADSQFNAGQLDPYGWGPVPVLPLMLDPRRYAVPSDAQWLHQLGDGRPNILFVGRCAPNKCWQDVILTFYYLKRRVRPDARLCLVGSAEGMGVYEKYLRALVERLALEDVLFCGKVRVDELVSFYQTASVFLCMSEHEGFGVPLIESMHFGVPIIAYAAGAVPETLGSSAILIHRKDHARVAELAGLLFETRALREQVIARQRERLTAFGETVVRKRLREYLKQIA